MLVDRMIRAAKLDPDLYYEVQRDRAATPQAFQVVLIVLTCLALSAVLSIGFSFHLLFIRVLFELAMSTIGGWIMWALVASLVAARMRGRGDFEELLRAGGFAHAPGVLYLFTFVPSYGRIIALVAWLWITIASAVAVREVFRFDTKSAALTAIVTTVILALICLVTGFSISMLRQVLSWIGLG